MALWTKILKLKVDHNDDELLYLRCQMTRMRVTNYPEFSAYMTELKISLNLIESVFNQSKISGEKHFFQIMNAKPLEWEIELRLIRYRNGNVKDWTNLVEYLLQYKTELPRMRNHKNR